MPSLPPPATPLPWVAKRDWEDYTEPDDVERDAYLARPFTRLETTVQVPPHEATVVNAHDLFTFKPGDAQFIVGACNAHNDLVTALESILRTTQHADSVQAFQVHQEALRALSVVKTPAP